MKQFPERIKAIAGFIPKGKTVADIGTDHALLPVFLLKEGKSPSVIASDLNEGPLEAARKTVREFGVSDRISLRLGDGLKTIKKGDAEVAVIAGMGGGTIKAILEECHNDYPVSQLVLQPMGDSGELRKWLVKNGWKIENEEIIEEDERLYEIISATRGVEEFTDWDVVSLGPRLIEKKHPLLKKIIIREIEKNRKIIKELENSPNAETVTKRENILHRNHRLEWIAECLLNVKL